MRGYECFVQEALNDVLTDILAGFPLKVGLQI